MAKKKKSVELSDKNITCKVNELDYKLIRFYPSAMSVDVKEIGEDSKKGMQNIPFAHLPKEIKKQIKNN
ncbi:MAG: hypothetical protein U9R50_09695 [Campylobacterota bacterium]|nr:hypothetical protein [Campylobacterota bacterium]